MLGELYDLLLARDGACAVSRILEDPVRLFLGFLEHLLALLDDPARLLDLVRELGANLVDDLVDLLGVDKLRARQRQ